MHTEIAISIVLPVHNEEENIGELLKEIVDVFKNNIQNPYEIIVVDDASDDMSIAEVEKVIHEIHDAACEENPCNSMTIRLVRLPTLSGQARALIEGFSVAQGNLIISMDSDGQYNPSDIPCFIEKMDAFDMVCGIRSKRRDGLARLLCSKIANTFRNWVTGDCIKDAGCTFRIMRKQCSTALRLFTGKLYGCEFFFHPLIIRCNGFRVGEINIAHRRRLAGKGNYKLLRGRLLRGLVACIKVRKLLKTMLNLKI